MSETVRASVKTPETRKEKPVSRVQKGNFYQPVRSPIEQIIFLQRTIGNQSVQRLMKSGALQAKLRIGAPGDVYEQEADRVAEQVMRMPEPQALSSDIPSIQRVCPKCENDELKRQPIKEENEEEKLQSKTVEEEEEELQAKATSGGISEVNPDLESHIQSLKGGGKPLSENERAFFEPRFGQDFSQVRLHIDTRAAEMARAVNARAFTLGKDMVFGEREYAPETRAGRLLLAHELTHTIQQGTGLKKEPGMFKIGESERENEITGRAIMHANSSKRLFITPMQIARQKRPDAGTQPPPCPVAPLAPITDPDALAMEGGATLIWNHTSPGLQTAANQLVALINAEPGGNADITSAYRPQAYQDHLREVWDKARALQSNTSPECTTVRTAVNQEMTHHSLNINRPVATVSNHTAGNAVDISWSLPRATNEETRIDELAGQAGLTHRLHAGDRPHFEL